MGRGTTKQIQAAKKNIRIGQCLMPHCKTLMPAKSRFFGMCWLHRRHVEHWIKKTGYPRFVLHWLDSGFWDNVRQLAADYCEWLNNKAH